MNDGFGNEVFGGYPKRVIGFKCDECGGVFQAMWGNTCNGCRVKERRHRELIAAIWHPTNQHEGDK